MVERRMARAEALVNEHLRLMKVDEYERLSELGVFDGERVELIQGRVIRVSAMGDEHQWTIQKMSMVLMEYFGRVADVRVQLPLRAGVDSVPEPDFALVPKTGDVVTPIPRKVLLVVEVADSSVAFDRIVKAPLYAAGPTPEYWVVNIKTGSLEVFRKPKRGVFTERFKLNRSDVIRPVSFSKIEVPVRLFFSARSH